MTRVDPNDDRGDAEDSGAPRVTRGDPNDDRGDAPRTGPDPLRLGVSMFRRLRRHADRARDPRRLVDARPLGPPVPFTFDGRPMTAPPGQSLAAALWAAGILSWRTTRVGGRPRGVFCGIGQCFDCLVTVNGRPGRRACLVPAAPGDVVTTQEGHGHADLDTP